MLGYSLLPFLPLQLNPSQTLPSLTIRYQWQNAAAELIEQQVTAPLEGLFSTIKGLERVHSLTYPGKGEIRLDFTQHVNLDIMRFEVGALIRQSLNQLPIALTYPQVEMNLPDDEANTSLLRYTLSANENPSDIQWYAEEVLSPRLAQIQGLGEIEVYGADPYAWQLGLEPAQLKSWGLETAHLKQVLNEAFFQAALDQEYRFASRAQFPNLLLAMGDSTNKRLVPLQDIVRVQRKERPAQAYYRVNGKNAINLVLYSEANANQLRVAKAVYATLEQLTANFPPSYEMEKTYDATTYVHAELSKIAWRSILSLFILLFFVWLISRSYRYLLIIFLSLLANLGIAGFCYYLLGLELNLYALAGITVSLGLIIDNSIMMIDHLRVKGNLSVFLPLLAATLTSIGALSVIFLMEEDTIVWIQDFAWVIITNLAVSLAVALWLIPALTDQIEQWRQFAVQGLIPAYKWRRYRSLSVATQYYRLLLSWAIRRRGWLLAGLILLFGLPVFLLPDQWEAEGKLPAWYNQTLGNPTYVKQVKPWVNRMLGGSIRLFVEDIYPNAIYQEPTRTSLTVRSRMPYGSTLDQMDQNIRRIEHFLSQFPQIEQYQTQVLSSQQAQITILFDPVYDTGAFPYLLKNQIEGYVSQLGAAEWFVWGVGKGFSLTESTGAKNSRIVLLGYNFDVLQSEAEKLKRKLLQDNRIEAVFLNGKMRWSYRANFEYVLALDKQKLARENINPQIIFQLLRDRSLEDQRLQSATINGRREDIFLSIQHIDQYDLWHLLQEPLQIDSSKQIKLSSFVSLKREQAGEVIERENQQYKLLLEYDYLGPNKMARKLQEKMIDMTNQQLPLGYLAEAHQLTGAEPNPYQRYGLILLVIAIIYFICAVLLESLVQPLVVIGMIPISFIGVFLVFYCFELPFDQGGYAAFLLLSGIGVNASLFILNAFNNQAQTGLTAYIKAYNSKILPILLTIVSTILGLIPFLLGGTSDPFWFSLSAGTIGGLFFSILGIFLYLPIFLLKKNSTQRIQHET